MNEQQAQQRINQAETRIEQQQRILDQRYGKEQTLDETENTSMLGTGQPNMGGTDDSTAMRLAKSGTAKRKVQYDELGWKYDETIKGYNKDGAKK